MDALIFVDTNIFLDFYRVRSETSGLSMLERIAKNMDSIISSTQVEMEFKNNRQSVIIESLQRFKTPDWGGLTPPAFVSESVPAKAIIKNKKEISKQQAKLKNKVEAILRNPSRNDPVFKVVLKILKHKGPYNLSRSENIRHKVRRLALKRFFLGYPPRKNKAFSLGDAINWEWIIHCSKLAKKDVIIVSRDTDYGITYNDKPILNDWLSQEFKERVSSKRKIILTNKLSDAFKLTSVPVSSEEEEEEKELISSSKISHEIQTEQNISKGQGWSSLIEEIAENTAKALIKKQKERQ